MTNLGKGYIFDDGRARQVRSGDARGDGRIRHVVLQPPEGDDDLRGGEGKGRVLRSR